MNGRPLKSRAALVALAVSVAWIENARGAESETGTSDSTQRIELAIENRSLQLQDDTLRVTEGDTVELVWTTDEDVELHLHGYDIELNVSTDAAAVMAFEAHATGRFPITSHGFGDSHDGHQTLLYLEVHPR